MTVAINFSGKVLDVMSGTTTELALIIQYPDQNSENQQWKLVKVN